MKISNIWTILSLLMVAALLGCSVQPGGAPVKAESIQSEKPRADASTVPDADVQELTAGSRAFAVDLYHQVGAGSDNLFFSPHSISLALAMLQAGAQGDTLTEINDALHYTLPQERLHPAYNRLTALLAEEAERVVDPGEKPFKLNVANALWGQQDYEIQQAYLDLLAEQYGAGMQLVDYENNPEAARQTINEWVSQQTEQKIKDLVPQGSITNMTRLVLTNAIYFNASWLNPFSEEYTKNEPFHKLDGSTADVPMMHRQDNYAYFKGEGFQVVELPYVATNLLMSVIVPDEGQFEAFEQGLTAEQLDEIFAGIGYTEVDLGLPKFKVESSFGLSEALNGLGMTQSFVPDQADFSGITGNRDLYVQDVVHKAYVAVDEAGTEAAAATAVMMGTTSMPLEPVSLTVDRPFIFLIRERNSGAILFMGRVMAP